MLREIEEKGVDEATREALSADLGEHGAGNTRVLVAAGGRSSSRSRSPTGWAPRSWPTAAASRGRRRPSRSPAPTQHHIRKVHAGGWSSRRYEETAENLLGARRRGGRVRGRRRRERRPGAARRAGRRRPGGEPLQGGSCRSGSSPSPSSCRAPTTPTAGSPVTARRIGDAVAERLRAITDDLLTKYEQERGQRDKATDGVADTLAALRMAQVDVLIITTALPSDATAFFDAQQPTVVGLSLEDVTGLGGQQPTEAPLVDVLLRAALGDGATVRVVPGDRPQAPQHGVGALLRFGVADGTVA